MCERGRQQSLDERDAFGLLFERSAMPRMRLDADQSASGPTDTAARFWLESVETADSGRARFRGALAAPALSTNH
jgi:hypothetical protein